VEEWRDPLRKAGVKLANFEMFRSDRNDTILGLHGDLPSITDNVVSNCKYDTIFPTWLSVDTPSAMKRFIIDGRVIMHLDDEETQWYPIMYGGQMYLKPYAQPSRIKGRMLSIVKETNTRISLRRGS
jgi:hypothetical protein